MAMPRLDGVEATRIHAGPDVHEPLAVVVITTFDTDDYVTGALRSGPRAFSSRTPGPTYSSKPSAPPPKVMPSLSPVSPLACSPASPRRRAPRTRPSRSFPSPDARKKSS